MSRFCRLFADLCLYFMEECGKVIHGYGMRRKGERLGAALRLMTNQIAREPVFRVERIPVRIDRPCFPR